MPLIWAGFLRDNALPMVLPGCWLHPGKCLRKGSRFDCIESTVVSLDVSVAACQALAGSLVRLTRLGNDRIPVLRLACLARFGFNCTVYLQAGHAASWANSGPGTELSPGSTPMPEAAAGTGHAGAPAGGVHSQDMQHALGRETQVWWSRWCRRFRQCVPLTTCTARCRDWAHGATPCAPFAEPFRGGTPQR